MKRQKWSGVDDDDLGRLATPERFAERLGENVLSYLNEVRPDLVPSVAAILTRFQSSHDEETPTPAELLRAKWVEELEDFQRMTWAAQRGYKEVCDGHPDRHDMDLYDQEAQECERLGAILAAVVLPPDATPEAARELAFKALEAGRTTANGKGGHLSRQYAWANAVVEGDAKRHWNSYHPRFGSPTTGASTEPAPLAGRHGQAVGSPSASGTGVLIGGLQFPTVPSTDDEIFGLAVPLAKELAKKLKTEEDGYWFVLEQYDLMKSSSEARVCQAALEFPVDLYPIEYQGRRSEESYVGKPNPGTTYLEAEVLPALETFLEKDDAELVRVLIFGTFCAGMKSQLNDIRLKHAVHFHNNCVASNSFRFADEWAQVVSALSKD